MRKSYKHVWKKAGFRQLEIDVFLENREKDKVLKGISFFLAAASEGGIGSANDFPTLLATLCKKVPRAMGTGKL